MTKKPKHTSTGLVQLVLIKEVKELGQAGTIIGVKKGYAKNYLIPHGLAQIATPQVIKLARSQQAKEQKKHQAAVSEIQKLADLMRDKTITIPVKVGEKKQVYGSVGPAEIATAMKDQHKVAVSPLQIKLDKPIKTLGEHPTQLKFEEGVTVTINVVLKEEKA